MKQAQILYATEVAHLQSLLASAVGFQVCAADPYEKNDMLKKGFQPGTAGSTPKKMNSPGNYALPYNLVSRRLLG